MFCQTQKREVHLLSDGELRAYRILLSLPETVAVMEQYALDIDETLLIANDLGFVHPRNYKTFEATVMTTDFLVRTAEGHKPSYCAYTYKYSNQIFEDRECDIVSKKAWRTWQKFKIEEAYWSRRGIEYRIITEKHATKEHHWNLEFCSSARDLVVDPKQILLFTEVFKSHWISNEMRSLQELCELVANDLKMPLGESKRLFKYAVIHGLLPIIHNAHLRFFRPVSLETAKPFGVSDA